MIFLLAIMINFVFGFTTLGRKALSLTPFGLIYRPMKNLNFGSMDTGELTLFYEPDMSIIYILCI